MKGYMQLPTNQTQSVVVPVSIDYIKDLTNQAVNLQQENKELKEQCRWLDNEYAKKKEIILEDNQNLRAKLSTSYDDTTFWKSEYQNAANALKRQLNYSMSLKDEVNQLHISNEELTNTIENLRSDASIIKEKTVKFFKENQESKNKLIDEIKELRSEVQRLSILAISSSTVVKDASENKVNLSQSEIDFLKSYLSQCLTDTAENIADLKADARHFKPRASAYSNSCYKEAEKMQKKANVLSGIQHKLKKTVLNRKVQAAPQVKQEVYAGHKQAWIAVCDAIEVYYPKFLSESGTGIECAVRAVHTLGKEAQRF